MVWSAIVDDVLIDVLFVGDVESYQRQQGHCIQQDLVPVLQARQDPAHERVPERADPDHRVRASVLRPLIFR